MKTLIAITGLLLCVTLRVGASGSQTGAYGTVGPVGGGFLSEWLLQPTNIFAGTNWVMTNYQPLSANLTGFSTLGTNLLWNLPYAPANNFPANGLLVDSINGNDATGQRGNAARPFKTIGYWQNCVLTNVGYMTYYPTGALLAAQGGDTVFLAPGYFTNFFVSLWKYTNGINLVGSGEGISHIYVPLDVVGNSGPTYGSLIQLGNNSVARDFDVAWLTVGGNGQGLGPSAFGPYTGGIGTMAWTSSSYPGFTHGLMQNICYDKSQPNWRDYLSADFVYKDGFTNCDARLVNVVATSATDAYAAYTSGRYGGGFADTIEFDDCVFEVYSNTSNGPGDGFGCINLSSGNTGTNKFVNCILRIDTSGEPYTDNWPNGVFANNLTATNDNIVLFNPFFDTISGGTTNVRVNADSGVGSITIIGGNASTVYGPVKGNWNNTAGMAIGTNTILPPVPSSQFGTFWNSNNAIFWVTSLHTNYISGP